MSEHIVSPKIYVAIFAALMLGTGITVWAAFQNFHQFNIVIARSRPPLLFSTSCTPAIVPSAPSLSSSALSSGWRSCWLSRSPTTTRALTK